MIWVLIILLLLLLFILWLLLAPLQLEIDSRYPLAQIRWISIGRARIWYEEEWWLSFRIFFIRKTLRIASMKAKPKKISSRQVRKHGKKRKGMLKKMIRVLHSFRVLDWKLAIDTGNYPLNAQLYPLNYFGGLHHHLQVNFNDENYFHIRIRNSPWRMLWAFLR